MRIALTHNLALGHTEEEAEFDRPETIAALCEALRSLGHEAHPVEVSGPVAHTISRLDAIAPDLVVNTAEGRRGRFREAFFPALLDELGIPYTGSDAYVCALTLDKHMTKMIAAAHGVPVPRGALIHTVRSLRGVELTFPLIIKPNHEGSSKGITADSIVDNPDQLVGRVKSLLARFPDGILVEEFIPGRDITVPYLEGSSPATGGVLPPAEYLFPGVEHGSRAIYDYTLKQGDFDAVKVRVPAHIDESVRARLAEVSHRAIKALGVRDLARIDYRVTPDGAVYFLEINALPSLEPGASLYEAAAHAGRRTVAQVLDTIVRSALRRRGLGPERKPARRGRGRAPLRVGLIHNLRRETRPGEDPQEQAEFDSPRTIEGIKSALETLGHHVIPLEATADLPRALPDIGVDVAFNIAEGLRGRSREAQVPALLEMLGIEYTGSDPVALNLTLDKALAKQVVARAGVLTPAFVVMETGRERVPRELTYPLIVKPVAEGSSKGIEKASVVRDESELRERARAQIARYRQPVLVEAFVGGREFTVGVLGERRLRALPPMEIVFLDDSAEHPVYTYDDKFEDIIKVSYETRPAITPALQRTLERSAKAAFRALGCRDVARVDFRLDERGRVHFLECNPLPGLTPSFSDLCKITAAAGIGYTELIGEILAPALRRRKAERRARPTTASRSHDPRGKTHKSPARPTA